MRRDEYFPTFASSERMPVSLRYDLAAMRFELAAVKFYRALIHAGFNPSQPRVPAGNPDGGQWTNGDGSEADVTRVMSRLRRNPEDPAVVRSRIVATASQFVGSTEWADDPARGRFEAGSNKCNLFVYEVLTLAGASPGLPNGYIHGNPPTAGQWADPNYAIDGWVVLKPGMAPLPGDVVAQRIPYSDASGHVMIVGPNGTVIGTGHRLGQVGGTIEQIPEPRSLGPDLPGNGPKVYRRWQP